MSQLYDVIEIESAIEMISEQNQGEIPPELFQALIEAQTKSIESLEKLCRYIRYLEIFAESAKSEKQRINDLQKRAESRIESIKKYITPFILLKGKIMAGIFTLSNRKSKYVVLDDNFDVPEYVTIETIIKPDKKRIKDDLEKGVEIPGARLVSGDNIQIK